MEANNVENQTNRKRTLSLNVVKSKQLISNANNLSVMQLQIPFTHRRFDKI